MSRPRSQAASSRVGAVMARQAQDADARPVALLGMRPALQDQRRHFGGARADRRGVGADALDRPVGITPVRARHVFGDRRVAAAAAAAEVHGDALALAEQLDRVLGDAGIELLADQPVRHRVVMPVDIDVVVAPDPARPPFGVLVGLGRKLLQRRAVEFEEQLAPADTEAAHRPRVEIGDQLGDRPVQLGRARRSGGS